MNRTTFRRLRVALPVTCMLALAACGSDSSSAPTTAAPATTTAATEPATTAPETTTAATDPATTEAATTVPAMPGEGKSIAFSPLALSIPALQGLSEGVKAVGGGMGYDVQVLDPNFDAPTQSQQLLQLIETDAINAAWIISVNPGSMRPVIEAAQKHGIVLVVNGVPSDYGYDGMIPGVTFANIDREESGKAVGELAGNCINDKLGGKANVIFLGSEAGTAGKEEMEGAMIDTMQATAPGATIVANEIVSERAAGQTTVGQVLQAHPDANVVVATNDEGTLGALGAFKTANIELPCLIGFGGNDEVLALVDSGDMYGVAALNFQGDMMNTFDAIARMLADPTADGAQQSVPLDIKTAAG